MPLGFGHRLGAPGTPDQDEWAFQWTDGTERLHAAYRAPDPDAAGSDPTAGFTTMFVETGFSSDRPTTPQRVASIDALAAVHTTALGGAPEIVGCDYVLRTCSVTTHEASGLPGASPQSLTAQPRVTGVLVGLDSGIVIQASFRTSAMLAGWP